MRKLTVHQIGTEVRLTNGDNTINALISGICVRRNDHVTYECVWIKNGDRCSTWVEEFEVTHPRKREQQIGFME